MNKPLLFISSSKGRQAWLSNTISALKASAYPIIIRSSSRRFRKNMRREHIYSKSFYLSSFPSWLGIFIVPCAWIFFGTVQLFRILRFRPGAVILINWPEKIILTPFSSFFNTTVIWLEHPDPGAEVPGALVRALYHRLARKVKIVAFGNELSEFWKTEHNHSQVSIVFPPSVPVNAKQHDLFKTMADHTDRSRFVVASVLYGLPKDQAERLLSAVSITQSVCPNIELVIIGAGKNRQQIQWLVRRMGLERRVWLAGPTDDFERWLNHLDTYIIATPRPTLDDASWAIAAMSAKLPVLAPKLSWLSDVITEKNGALIDVSDPETIARQLINLQQNEELRAALGKEAQKTAERFSFVNFSDSIHKLF